MANSPGVCVSFKADTWRAIHNLEAHTIKVAVFSPTASIGPATSTYTNTGEVTSSGYPPGGATLSNAAVQTSGFTVYWTPGGSISFNGVTFSSDCALMYNSTQSNKSIASFTYGVANMVSGNFTLSLPTNDVNNALLRLT